MTDEVVVVPNGNGEAKGMTRTPPPMYAVLRAGSTSPEPLRANTDDEARETLRKQVRAGQLPFVFLYKLVSAEVFEPSSVTLDLEEIKDGKFNAAT